MFIPIGRDEAMDSLETFGLPLTCLNLRDISTGQEPLPIPVAGLNNETLVDHLGSFRVVCLILDAPG